MVPGSYGIKLNFINLPNFPELELTFPTVQLSIAQLNKKMAKLDKEELEKLRGKLK